MNKVRSEAASPAVGSLDRRGLLLSAAALLSTAPLAGSWIAPATASDSTEDTVDIAGLRLFYRTEGSGEPLLLIAGFSCDSSIWDTLAPLLRTRFRLIRFDNRGIGRSVPS